MLLDLNFIFILTCNTCYYQRVLIYLITSQVGLPIAAGVLLPVTGTILTPSIAGALMGFSSVGVMANSLLLRVKLSSRQKPTGQADTTQEPQKTISDAISDTNEIEKSYSSKWRST